MSKFMFLVKFLSSSAYRKGWAAGADKKGEIANPYSQAATLDNLSRGLGASPWWETEYKPFIHWQQGRGDRVFFDWDKND